jgi:hypothetical protein
VRARGRSCVAEALLSTRPPPLFAYMVSLADVSAVPLSVDGRVGLAAAEAADVAADAAVVERGENCPIEQR